MVDAFLGSVRSLLKVAKIMHKTYVVDTGYPNVPEIHNIFEPKPLALTKIIEKACVFEARCPNVLVNTAC